MHSEKFAYDPVNVYVLGEGEGSRIPEIFNIMSLGEFSNENHNRTACIYNKFTTIIS